MGSKVTPNTFCTYTNGPGEAGTTIFFVSGNPGLIGYYHPFLSLLARYLGQEQDTGNLETGYQIYGCSLGGFEVDDADNETPPESISASGSRRDRDRSEDKGTRLYDLEDQIRFVQGKLAALMDENENVSADRESTRRRKVILAGHSVGAYIAMEVLRRHRETASNGSSQSPEESSKTSSAGFDIVGGVMLFPTVIDIALSPSGQKLTVGLTPSPQSIPCSLTLNS